MKKEDVDLKQVMAEERSRGRSHPIKAETLEIQRQMRKVGEMLANKNCDRTDFINVLRDDLGLEDESERFRKLLELWDAFRGTL